MRAHNMSTSKARRIFVLVVGGSLVLVGAAAGIGGALGLWWFRTSFDPRALEEDDDAWRVASVALPDGGEAMLLRRRDHPLLERYERRMRLFRAEVPGLELPLFDLGEEGPVRVGWWPSTRGPHLVLDDDRRALAVDLDRGLVRRVTPQGYGALLVEVGASPAGASADGMTVVPVSALEVQRWPPITLVELGRVDEAWSFVPHSARLHE